MSQNLKPVTLQGWLWKWTNYLKGYQRRWFVLSNGLLSYYQSQVDMAHTCRGTINLAASYIAKEDECNFVVSNRATHKFHLRASSIEEREKWITALENAKAAAMFAVNVVDDLSDDNVFRNSRWQKGKHSFSTGVLSSRYCDNFTKSKALSQKLDALITCNELLEKHTTALQRSLTELEAAEKKLLNSPQNNLLTNKLKNVRERSTLLCITSSAMLDACSEFLSLSQTDFHATVSSMEEESPNSSPTLVSSNSVPINGSFDDSEKALNSDEELFSDASSSFIFPETAPAKNASLSTDKLKNASNTSNSSAPTKALSRQYRTSIPFKPDYSLNLWNILKNCIGKDLTKIPMPVNFNEPLSFLQRLIEDVEYYSLINKAANCSSSQEQMAYVVALSVSTYASTINRISKPFNPLLGETFEYDRCSDLGFRAVCEQVSHHPPVAAVHVDSANAGPNSGWSYWTEITVTSKFRGQYLNITPLGTVHLKFHDSGNHYTWHKVTTTAHNIVVGTVWVDQSGKSTVTNHKTGDYCTHTYTPYSYFSSDTARKVDGVVMDKNDVAHFVVSGKWDSYIDCAKISSINLTDSRTTNPSYSTLPAKRLWEKIKLPPNAKHMYYFSLFSMTLNDEENGVPPTDSRFRPDQREMEKGNWDAANALKIELEDAQRKRIRENHEASSKDPHVEVHKPIWFKRRKCDVTGEVSYVYNGKYWAQKKKQDWSACPQIFCLTAKDGGPSLSVQSSTHSHS